MILFATVKFHMSFEKWLKLGEQRKIPGVNITKVCANLSAHLPYMLAEEHMLQHVFCRVFTCGNLCEKNRSIELNTKHSDISTKVGP